MAVRASRGSQAFVWIPPAVSAAYKLTVERQDGTIDDLTLLALPIEIEDGATETIGRFEFSVGNPDGRYTGVWTGTEVVRFYSDYASTATTLRFRGRIETVSYKGFSVTVSGRAEVSRITDTHVTASYTTTDCSDILRGIISSYASGYTTTNITTSNTTLTVNWFEKPFWDCVKDLCSASGFECYVDCNLDFHFFRSGSVLNQTEAIVHDSNLLEVIRYGPETTFVKNRVVVYGAQVEGIQTITTSEDLPSQTIHALREIIVTDNDVVNETQGSALAEFNIEDTPPIIGELKSVLLASIAPGDSILLSAPSDGISPGRFNIISFKHEINESMTTTARVSKEPRTLSTILTNLVQNQTKAKDTSANPYQMRYSYNFTFDTDSGSHSNTLIDSGRLLANSAPGVWLSPAKDETSTISQVYLIAVGEELDNITFRISANGGINYESISNKQRVILSTAAGSSLIVEVTLNTTSARLDSLSVLYKK